MAIYSATKNIPGYLPESEPAYFTDTSEAWDYQREEFIRCLPDDIELEKLADLMDEFPQEGEDVHFTEEPNLAWNVDRVETNPTSTEEEEVILDILNYGDSFGFKVNIPSVTREAFSDSPNREIARLLREVATKLEEGRVDDDMFDINGNSVGSWKYA